MALVTAAYWLAYYFRFDGDVPGRYERLFVGTVGIVIGVKLVVFVAMRLHEVVALHEPARPAGHPAGDGRVQPDPGGAALDMAPGRPRARAARRPGLRPPADPRPDRGRLRGAQRDRATAALRAREQRQGGADLRRGRRRRHPAARDEAEPRARVHARGPHRRRPPEAPAARAGHPRARHRADLPRVLREVHVDEVIIAMPSAPGRVREEIVQACRAAGVQCTTLPGLPELITGEVTVSQLREVRVEDVLGRAAIEVDFARVARYLNGGGARHRRGGSIGPELCRQVSATGASACGGRLGEQPLRDRPRAARARPLRAAGPGDRRLQGRVRDGAPLRVRGGRSCSTRRRTSTCR